MANNFDSSNILDMARMKLVDLYVLTPYHADALDKLKRTVVRHDKFNQQTGIMLVGESRTGKTTTLNKLDEWVCQEYPLEDISTPRVVKVVIRSGCSPKDLAAVILRAINDPFAWSDSTKSKREDRAQIMINEVNPIAISFDEFQNIFIGKSVKQIASSLQTIKDYFNQIEIPIILSGLPIIIELVLATDELRERFNRVAELPTYTLEDPVILANFRDFLDAIAEVVPLDYGVKLTEDEYMLRILLASRGITGPIIDIFMEACDMAEKDHAERVGEAHLTKAFDNMLYRYLRNNNPFSLSDVSILDEASRHLGRKF